MATLPSKAGNVTLLDWAKSLDPDGKTADTVELLNQSNEVLNHMMWIEGNLPTGHRAAVRTGLPTVIWRQMYQGVPTSKSSRATVEDACGMLEARNEVDADLCRLNANEASFRLSEAQAFLEAMNQEFASTLFYGDTATTPERFMGLAPRYSTVNTSTAQTAKNVIDAGGSGSDNTSVWLIVWGKQTVHGIFPKGSKAGISHQDLGEIDAFDGSNNRFRAMADLWKWKCGLHVKDWRYIVRIANVDVSDLVGLTGTQAVTAATYLPKLMVKALARIPFRGMGRAVFYSSRTVKEMLAIGAMDKSQQVMGIQPAVQQFGNVEAGFVSEGGLTVLGVPVATVDKLLETEARVV